MRVATRRLRAFLRAATPLVDPDWARTLRAELGWLGRGLGPARDLDVLHHYLENEIGQLEPDGAALAGLMDSVEVDRAAARAAVIAELTSTRYLELLARLDEAAELPLSGVEIALRDIFVQELDRTSVAFAALPEDPTDDELHGARIQVKRARYAAELAAGELGKKGGAFVDAAKEVQDVLGEHQDAVVAEDVVRTWLAGNPHAALAGGRLIERQRMRRDTARAAWPGAWRQLERAGRKATG
jgi:CHAD domain-containing protein